MDFVGGHHDDELIAAWDAVGVTVFLHTCNVFTGGKKNSYFLKTDNPQLPFQPISRDEALQHAVDFVLEHS